MILEWYPIQVTRRFHLNVVKHNICTSDVRELVYQRNIVTLDSV